MRKRRRLANKMTIMVCAVLIAVSAFFYAPIEVRAEGSLISLFRLNKDNAYVATGYGIQSRIYAGGDVEQNLDGRYFSILEGQNLYYEDSISFNIPFRTLNGGKDIPFDGETGRIYFNCGLTMNSVISQPSDYPELDLVFEQHVKEVYIVVNGQKYYGTRYHHDRTANLYGYRFDFYFDIPSDDFSFNDFNCSVFAVLENNITLDARDVDAYLPAQSAHWTVYPSVVFKTYTNSYNMPGYSVYVYDYNTDTVTDIDVELQTDEMQQATEQQTETMVNGFDNTQGDNVNADLSAGLDEYQTAEDSLFATATTGMKDFTFFDIESVPAMVTGISFITATMTGWFNQAGGASGVGIVLSILFSVMLVAMVLGLYRWYQSRGGKD